MQPFVGRAVVLGDSARSDILAIAAHGGLELETGGALFGFDDGTEITVTVASEPGPNAVREARYFLRDLAYTQAVASDTFASSGAQWIGEWHTHPRGPTEPSDHDINTYVHHLFDPELRFAAFVSIVLAPAVGPQDVGIHIWCLEPTELGVVLYDAGTFARISKQSRN
jgi:integrative and conjugative element protein (TIGR02256 family)